MTTADRIKSFVKLSHYLQNLSDDEFQSLALRVANENPWFTKENVRLALNGISFMTREDALTSWINRYTLTGSSKTVALVLAGNIPLVGFHDLLCVLVAGHKAMIKLSSKDRVLTEFIIDKLISFDPLIYDRITIAERLQNFDAVIATGSDNSSRYFEYYFGKYPHIIRKNRTSVAILTGSESPEELRRLGNDIFAYFGLGCRNVSKLFVPEGYRFDILFESWNSFKDIINHHKYCNNYDYQKSLLLINRVPFFDNGFVMIQESERIVSPISVIFFEYYPNQQQLRERLEDFNEKIQVVVGNSPLATVPLGNAQSPAVQDYADNVDTMSFLSSL